MKVSNVRQHYVLNGIITLTEGTKYRVKSGVFEGLVGTFSALERDYPSRSAVSCLGPVSLPVACEEVPASPELLDLLAGLRVRREGSLESAYLQVEVMNLELAE